MQREDVVARIRGVRSSRRSATFASVTPSRPIISSSVGSVVGNCGQATISRAHHGQEGMGAARIGGIAEAEATACGGRRARSSASRPRRGPRALRRRPRGSARRRAPSAARSSAASAWATPSCHFTWSQVWMPTSKPASRTRAQHVGAALADVGTGQQRPVEQGADAVVGDAPRCGPPCRMNPGRSARLIARPVWSGPRLKRKVAPGAVALEHLDQARNALARAATGVDVDLEGELHGRSHDRRTADDDAGACAPRERFYDLMELSPAQLPCAAR